MMRIGRTGLPLPLVLLALTAAVAIPPAAAAKAKGSPALPKADVEAVIELKLVAFARLAAGLAR